MAITVLLHGLVLVTGWPPGEQVVVIFFPVGPLAGGAAAMEVLGEGVRGVEEEARTAVMVFSGVAAVSMIGVTAVSLVVAVLAVVYLAKRSEVRWNSTWLGVVFPVAMVGVLGIVGCVVLVVCVILWVVNLVFVVRSGIRELLLRHVRKRRPGVDVL